MTERGERALGAELKLQDLLIRAKGFIETGKDLPEGFKDYLVHLMSASAPFTEMVLVERSSYSKHERDLLGRVMTETLDLMTWLKDRI